MKVSISILALFVSAPAFAGGIGAHGGDAVLCKGANNVETVEVFDYWEGTELGRPIDLGRANSSEIEKARFALKRIEKLDAEAFRQYNLWLNTFFQEARFLDRAFIKDINDSRELIGPRGNCYKLQFAVQLKTPADFESRYLIDKYLWDRADSTQRAGLILHEIIYRDAISSIHSVPETSDGVRYYNSILSSSIGNGLDQTTYFRVLNKAALEWAFVKRSVVYNGLVYWHPRVNFYENGTLESGWLFREQAGVSVVYPQIQFTEWATYYSNGNLSTAILFKEQAGLLKDQPGIRFSGEVRFHPNGQLKSATPVDPITVRQVPLRFATIELDETGVLVGGKTLAFKDGETAYRANVAPLALGTVSLGDLEYSRDTQFYSNGVLKQGDVSSTGSAPIFLRDSTQPFGWLRSGRITYHESGYPQDVFVGRTRTWIKIPYLSAPSVKTWVDFEWKGTLTVSSDGRIEKLDLWGVDAFSPLKLVINGEPVAVEASIEFHPNGAPKTFFTSRYQDKYKFLCRDGKWKTFRRMDLGPIEMDENLRTNCDGLRRN